MGHFTDLLAEPIRNGLYKPSQFHGRGAKIVNMGELFAHPRLGDIDMRRIDVDERELARFRIETGDLLFARRSLTAEGAGAVCYVQAVNEPTVFESSLIRARLDRSKADPLFMYYWFRSHVGRARIASILRQVAVSGITGSDLGNLEVDPPSPVEQRAIAEVLGALDDKIDVNRRMNETLEEIARAIFKSWFVDFSPVHAKIEGRDTGLNPDIGARFPDRFVETDQGPVPEGWRFEPLAAITSELRRGISPKYVKDGGVRVLNQKCIRNRIVSFDAARRHDHNARAIGGRELQDGDILVNSTGVGTLGRVAQVWSAEEPTIVDSHVTVVRADRRHISALFLGHDLTGREAEIEVLGEGSTGQTELSRTRLGELLVLVPSHSVIEAFDTFARPMTERKVLTLKQSETLAILGDLLPPKLMSGEIHVRDAERLVGEAGV